MCCNVTDERACGHAPTLQVLLACLSLYLLQDVPLSVFVARRASLSLYLLQDVPLSVFYDVTFA